jgi:hypothetical protein
VSARHVRYSELNDVAAVSVQLRPISGSRIRKVASFRCGKGLSRESPKDPFAAAPCWCGKSDDSFNRSALKRAGIPGRRVYPDAIPATIFTADMR